MASKPFSNQVCLITGAASGIGRATAIKMSSLGCTLALQDIASSGLSQTDDLCGGGHYQEVFDVGKTSDCNAFISNTISKLGRIDHIFNCAGVNPTAYALEDTSDEYWDKLMNTNLKGTYNITRAAIPVLKEGSSIVNVSSIMGISVAANYAIYCASKWGIVGFTKAMALELGPKGIRVNAVAPGYIDTPTNAGVVAGPEAIAAQTSKVALGRMGMPEEVTDVVVFLFGKEARYMSGGVVEITGGRA